VGELRLEVREFQDLTRWRWVLSDERGGFIADHEVSLDAGCWQYEAFSDLLWYLDWHVAPDARVGDEARVVSEVGAWIGKQVLGPLAGVLAAARPATVRVMVGDTERGGVPEAARALLFRPLELAYANGKPLAVQDVTLVMEPESGSGAGKGISAGGRLRVLGLFSLPEGGQTLNLRRERQSLVELIRSIAADGKAADVRVLQYGVTRERLREVLEEAEGWDIIHISGHGAPGELLFEDVTGKPDPVTAEELAGMLDLARERVKLVTVAACWSAALTVAEQRRLLGLPVPEAEPRTRSRVRAAAEDGSPDDRAPEGGFAAGALATELTGRLDCAVLAMRYPVGDNFAIALASKLYGLLAEKGQTLPRAVGITLAQLAGELPWPSLSLATPALFGARAARLTLKAPERSGPEEYDPAKLKMAGFPQQPERFVGRTGVMTRASAALAAGSGVPGVLLHGMPGGGKTACALELAYTHEHAFGALIWYKAPDEGMDIKGALTDFTLTLENNLPRFQMVHLLADPAKLKAFLPRLTELVEQRRLLIVIDNIESLLSDGGQWRDEQWGQVIGALTAHRGRGRLILTTRRRPQTASGLQTESVR
jgi:CHAT domain